MDESIVELETDKVNVEVPSPAEGILSKINFNNGDTVEVGALLGIIRPQGENVIPIIQSTKQKKQKQDNKEKEIEQPLVLDQKITNNSRSIQKEN